MKNIIALVGMCGSGKSVACEYLESLGYKRVYFGGVTMMKLEELGLPVNPENERKIREDLRKELGMGAFAIVLLPKIKELAKDNLVVLDGLYSWDEYKILQNELENKVKLVAIITDKNIRYERLSKREIRPLTKEEVKKRDISEIENIAKGGPIAYADYFVFNNGSKQDLQNRLDEILKSIDVNKN